jgi:Xaa-Pro aminopeptidase
VDDKPASGAGSAGAKTGETFAARIAALRAAMLGEGFSCWIVPSADPHLSEYLPPRWQGRAWLSGFHGSAGTLVVTPAWAGLWVDSRYWVEAEAAVRGSGIEVVKATSAAGSELIEWLGTRVAQDSTAGADGACLGLALARQIEAALARRGAALRTDLDLLEQAWPARPGLPARPVRERIATFEARSRAEKLAAVRAAAAAEGADWHFLSSLDDIAWLLNLRGCDVDYNPVFLAHLLLGPGGGRLFVAAGAVDAALAGALRADGIALERYEGALAALGALPADAVLLLDPRRVTLGSVRAAPESVRLVERINPSTMMKSRKAPSEIAHVRDAMEQDGAALCEFFSWLEQALARRERITELTIDERLTAERARRPGYVSLSFNTIAAFNANGAAPHYRALPESHAVISDGRAEPRGLLLIDSGGQYEGGTTDITRVTAVGELTAEHRRDCTLVLRGMIQLSRARFPRGTRSPQLDALARAPIWAEGIDYGHGTGHGVGYFLGVHEGPHGITPHLAPEPHTAMEEGMITSNEPGIYRPGRWGVRIENLVATVSAGTGEFGEFLAFETLTLCPIDTRCIDRSLLREDEAAWLNDYHATVRARLSPLLQGPALDWLHRNTRPI